jgi:hypothetical protein
VSPLPKVFLEPGDFAVLTLTEPRATLVVLGEKEWETHGWPTSYCGAMLIQAAKAMPTWAQDSCLREPFESVLSSHGVALPSARPEDLGGVRSSKRFSFSFGCIIGAAYLADTAPQRSSPINSRSSARRRPIASWRSATTTSAGGPSDSQRR